MPAKKAPAQVHRVMVSKENPNVFYAWNPELAKRTDRLFEAYRDPKTGEIKQSTEPAKTPYAEALTRLAKDQGVPEGVTVTGDEVDVPSLGTVAAQRAG
jgi:hypothetical protein